MTFADSNSKPRLCKGANDGKLQKVAEQILHWGGAENVASVTHCMTRLRFNSRMKAFE
ncbi:MAG: PTS transporter subunit EIIB [Collinsella aerofaciens]